MTNSFAKSAFWDERFQNSEYIYGTGPNDFLCESTALLPPPLSILSLAEGEGRNAVYLASLGHQVHAVDFSVPARDKALKLAQSERQMISYDIADLSTYNMGHEQWDAVVSVFCHMPEHIRPSLYRSIASALKPGGYFILEAYNKDQLQRTTGGPKDPAHLISLSELKGAFCDWTLIHAEELEREVREGTYHTGRASVTQFIAQKQKN